MNKLFQCLRLIRVQQWIKNIFILLPIFFDQKIFEAAYVYPTLLVFILFSFTSSIIYCINDIKDIEADKLHPIKSQRPLASGKVSITEAIITIICLICLNVLLVYLGSINIKAVLIVSCYFMMNLLYTFFLKKIAIVDVAVIALGFTLRVIAGGFATSVYVSHWIIIMTFLITLFLAFAKRRDDCVILHETGKKVRGNTERYSISFIDTTMSILAAITIVAYLQYCLDPMTIARYNTDKIYITFIFVLLAILRYLQLSIVDNKSGNPTKLLMKDKFVISMVGLYVLTFVLLIYVL